MSKDTIDAISRLIIGLTVFTALPITLIHYSLHLGWWESIGFGIAIKFASHQASAERRD